MFFFLRILQIRQGMYTSVFGAREPETGRILAFDNLVRRLGLTILKQIVLGPSQDRLWYLGNLIKFFSLIKS